ncbi:glycine betaine ABC transporter substrate-binding protein [Halanaerobacter jeridensis]|uniref:Glycine betaine/proline transport system substrate-binding protein n=1 Tax=Halanaerobacter jeridensis TaxID=706427 RepID=A0A938XT59_9FIRM|nr:glycine betaine ABC transporter substrate-binding protein [Halanaerobacter jeridensis]MBM7557058.1 glycine betaine/proline transport system substrate-binding protein [Halanaerobacter jeridensis]
MFNRTNPKIFDNLWLFAILVILLIVIITGCSTRKTIEKKQDSKQQTIKIVYVKWDSEIASSNVIKAVIEEKLGYKAELLPVTLTALWQSIAAGDQDVTVAAWLPSLQKNAKEKYKDEVEILGPNLEGTRIGLVVPDYVSIDSITELEKVAAKFEGKIIGIEPDAGIMDKTRQMLQKYNLDDDFKLVSGSDQTMTTVLENAIKEKRWIAITGWTPHWKFAKWDLKYLDDPKNIYGDREHISTIVRNGLKEDNPKVYNFLDNFYWSASDMEEVMLLMQQEGTTPQEAAKKWVQENEDLVEKWVSE